MQFSYLAIFIVLLIILFAFLLVAPFHLSLNIRKKGPLLQGGYRFAWLGRTLGKAEISPQSAGDLLASIWKGDPGKEEQEGRSGTKAEKDTVRPPSIHSLINAAPALANILLDLFKSILFKKFSCSVCFGLDDPAQTAIISGYLWSLASALGLFPAKICFEPWFEGERLEGELMAEIEARMLWAVFAVIQALREREIRLLLREMMGWA
jgi:hypothetical protein